jgi:hypothetical protein
MKRRVYILSTALLILFGVNQKFAPTGKMQQANDVQTKSAIEKPPMFVLQVGIGKYLAAPELKGSRFDVEGMREVLTGERFNVPKNNIRTVQDEQATKERIVEEFENHLIKNARDYYERTKRRDAVALFQFSGHGSQVPDRDGDEEDKMDETFVTYASEDVPGKNFDITDDEIFALTKQLSRYTDNIVYILDSCHSGSGTRDAIEARRIPPRKTVPVPMLKTQTRGTEEKKSEDNPQSDLLPVSPGYIVISAAKAEQLALQKNVFADDASKYPSAVYGKLTYYLLENLRGAGANTTYRELMEEVTRKISSETSNSQIPQVEGEDRRAVFGGLSKREDDSIDIFAVKNKQISVKAGAMHGVTKQTILDVYDKNREKIATAKIVSVAADKSIANVVTAQREITTKDRAVIVSTDLGATGLKVLLDGEDAAKLSDADKAIIKTLQKNLALDETDKNRPRTVESAVGKWNDKQARWDVALLKDRFDKVFPYKNRVAPIKTGDTAQQFPSAEKEVFYLAGRDFVPLYGFFVESESKDAATRIEKALFHLARLRSVKAIANDKSALAGKIKITPVRLFEPRCENGLVVDKKKEPVVMNAAKTAYKFNQGERFRFEIVNNSKADVYITLLDIGTDGSVQVLFPRSIYEEKDGVKIAANGGKRMIFGEKCQDPILTTTPPTGLEIFKIIATTEKTGRADFEFLELDSINSRGKETSLTSVGDWTTAEINFEIASPQQ